MHRRSAQLVARPSDVGPAGFAFAPPPASLPAASPPSPGRLRVSSQFPSPLSSPLRHPPQHSNLESEQALHATIEALCAELRAERARCARIAGASRVGRLVSSSLSLEETLRTAVETVRREFCACSAGLFLVDRDDPQRLVLLDRRGFSTDVAIGHYSQGIAEGVIGEAASNRRALLVPDIRSHRSYIGFRGSDSRAAGSEIAVPLVSGDILLGVLNVESDDVLTDHDLQALQIVGAQLATAIDHARQFARSEQALNLAVVEERSRLARDLHDSVNQLIFSMSLIAQSLDDPSALNAGEAQQRVGRLLDLTDAAREEMRTLLGALRPAGQNGSVDSTMALPLERHGLESLIRTHAARVLDSGTHVRFDFGRYQPQSAAREEIVLRVAQEALGNVAKHAGACTVCLGLTCARGELVLTVRDDGVGFLTPARQTGQGGMGLASMRERAEEGGGTLCVRSVPGAGTRVRMVLPCHTRCERGAA